MNVSQILVFPVKGIAGKDLSECSLLMHGFENDRRWMLRDGEGNPVKAKKFPALRRIVVDCVDGVFAFRSEGRSEVTLSEDNSAVDQWLSEFVGEECHLVDVENTLDENGGRVSFSHGYPVLLQSEASLENLNARLDIPVTSERFRPNLVVDGCEAYAEDRWKTVRIGEVVFDVHEPCVKCLSTTIDPIAGVVDKKKEPYATLASYRFNDKGDVLFGMYMSPRSAGVIRVDDNVVVLETQAAPL